MLFTFYFDIFDPFLQLKVSSKLQFTNRKFISIFPVKLFSLGSSIHSFHNKLSWLFICEWDTLLPASWAGKIKTRTRQKNKHQILTADMQTQTLNLYVAPFIDLSDFPGPWSYGKQRPGPLRPLRRLRSLQRLSNNSTSRCRCALWSNSGEETGPGLGICCSLPILPMQTDTQHGGLE